MKLLPVREHEGFTRRRVPIPSPSPPRPRPSTAAAGPLSLCRRRPSTLRCPSSIRGRQIRTRSATSAASRVTPSRSCSSTMRGARTSWSSTSIPQPRLRRCPASYTAGASYLPQGCEWEQRVGGEYATPRRDTGA